mgnify:CR=1 FL=1
MRVAAVGKAFPPHYYGQEELLAAFREAYKDDSDFMEAAAFRGSTRLDARTGLEIFEISADITTPAGGADVAGS